MKQVFVMRNNMESRGKTDVKREVVSASANLEVISQESFVKRLEGMSSACHNCHRERTRSQRNKSGRKGKASRRKQQAKSNMPIVIHLKDTLRYAGRSWQNSLDGDSDMSARSTDEEQYSSSSSSSSGQRVASRGQAAGKTLTHQASFYKDISSIPEFVPRDTTHLIHQTWPYKRHVSQTSSSSSSPSVTNHKSSQHFFFSSTSQKEKSQKNLTALISVIEKAHMKDPKDIEPNLSRNSTDGKLASILNNVTPSTQSDSKTKRKNMAECQNVELICNDLSISADRLAESTDDSDTSDKSSVVSSTDTMSDDVQDHMASNEVRENEFASTQLEQLAEYTIETPPVRYDYSSSQCSDCFNSLYAYQYFHYTDTSGYTNPGPSPRSQRNHHSHLQHQRVSSHAEQRQKLTGSHKTSLSSDSDPASDIEDAFTTSARSSPSSSANRAITSVLVSIGSEPAFTSQCLHKASRNPYPIPSDLNHKRSEARGKHPIKRATASWKGCQLWDIGVSQQSRRSNAHGCGFTDSVYMDLTGLDISISVIYHSEATSPSLTWPYPVHSFYQAVYSPLLIAPTPGISQPFKFNPFISEQVTANELKKYEMTLPPNRPWIMTGTPDKDVAAAVFTVMCYNVLCDKLCTKAMYAYCPTWALSWDYRKKIIMSDILRGNADIITLQEVETEQYYSMFLPELAQQGYDGIFLPKSRVKTMNSDKEKKTVDGCAIFFKKTKFEKVNEYHIEFSQLATKEGASNTDTDMINRVSTKDNIAVVAVLKTKPGAYENSPVAAAKGLTQMLMVSTAHIHWDPQSPDVKLVQTMMLIEELQKFVKEACVQFRPNAPPPALDADLCNSMPLILCGDFNSLPDSGVYEFLSKGRLDTNHKDFEGQNYPVFMKDRNDNGNITHNFNLTSAYKDVIPFTNYTFDFKGIIDYIFYSDQHLRLHGVMGLQDEEWFRANKIIGCPHPFVPSDHFPLFAEFSLPVSTPQQRPR